MINQSNKIDTRIFDAEKFPTTKQWQDMITINYDFFYVCENCLLESPKEILILLHICYT